MSTETITIEEASAMLKVSKPTARKILGEPDDIVSTARNLPRFLYLKRKVEQEAKCLECMRNSKPVRGLHKCRSCPAMCRKEDLVSGRCKDCRAFFLLKNFSCHGDCFRCKNPDCEMIRTLETQLSKLKNQSAVS